MFSSRVVNVATFFIDVGYGHTHLIGGAYKLVKLGPRIWRRHLKEGLQLPRIHSNAVCRIEATTPAYTIQEEATLSCMKLNTMISANGEEDAQAVDKFLGSSVVKEQVF